MDVRNVTRDEGLSLPIRGAWIEICICQNVNFLMQSLPIRGAWIEIPA